MNKKGLTLIELLVTMAIFVVLISAVYLTYTTIYSDYRKESKNMETEIEKAVGLDLLKLDITHIGFGISDNETSKVLECLNCDDTDPSNNRLILRSTFNVTNNLTQHWILVNQDDGITVNPDNLSLTSSTLRFVFLDYDKKLIADNVSYSSLTASYPTGKYLGFPVEPDDTGCINQLCTKIEYYLTNSSLPERCNSNIYNLDRKVNGGTGVPIFNCVADFTIRIDYDRNDDGNIDSSPTYTDNEEFLRFSDIPSTVTADNLKKRLKRVTVYILIQEGSYDKDFDFSGNVLTGNRLLVKDFNGNLTDCVNNDVCLQLPSDYQHYRWRVITYSIKPMDL